MSEEFPSSEEERDWIFATPKGERFVRVRRRDFLLKMRLEDNEVVFVEERSDGLTERRYQLSEESLDWGAENYDIKTGKWLVFRSRDQIDDVWRVIEKTTHDERLGIATKVSTKKQGKNRYVICVYTKDYLDDDDVNRVRAILRSLGIEELLYYKPDIYTRLGIYSGTTKLRPWRYKD